MAGEEDVDRPVGLTQDSITLTPNPQILGPEHALRS